MNNTNSICLQCKNKFWRCTTHIFLKEKYVYDTTDIKDDYIIFVLSGSLRINFNAFRNREIIGGEMFFLPKSENYSGIVTSDVELVVLIYTNPIEVGDRLLMESLNSYAEEINYDFKGLEIRKPFYIFLRNLLYYTKEEIPCNNLYKIKRAELTLLFQMFYTKQEQAMFFYYVIGSNLKFRNMVLDNYLQAKTAEELGTACGYEKSTFQRLFRKYFGQTPYKWMQKEISKHIYEKLIDKEVPLKVIVDEFGFSSSGHFTNYCKRLFDATPIQIRNGFSLNNEEI